MFKQLMLYPLIVGLLLFSGEYSQAETASPQSYADPVLKTDVLKAMEPYVIMLSKSKCNQSLTFEDVIKTTVSSNYGSDQPWRETWEVRACDNVYSFDIGFTPDKKNGGTAFAVKLSQ